MFLSSTWRVSTLLGSTVYPCRQIPTILHSRYYAAAADTDFKPKPKASTPLRRSASASLPIRTNPTPTRSDIQTVFTLATAKRFVLSRLRTHSELPARFQTLHESWWIPKWSGKGGREGEIFLFPNGTYVCWGLGEEDALDFKAQVIDRAPGMQIAPLREAEDEELEFVVDPSEFVYSCPSFHAANSSAPFAGKLVFKGI